MVPINLEYIFSPLSETFTDVTLQQDIFKISSGDNTPNEILEILDTSGSVSGSETEDESGIFVIESLLFILNLFYDILDFKIQFLFVITRIFDG
jgi:hypothetical protein